jgi:hypothetical protein
LCHALAAQKEKFDFTNDNLVNLDDIAIASRGLLVVRHPEGLPVLRVCHWTAADFFERRDAVSAGSWSALITRTCLDYLSLPVFATGPQVTDEQYQQRVASYPFYEYASRYWAAHFKDVADPVASSELRKQALVFLGNSASVASSAQALMRATSQPDLTDMHALSLVAYLDLPSITQTLLPDEDTGQALDLMAQVDSVGRTALMWAACSGASSVVGILIKRRRWLNDHDKAGDTALSLAASRGHIDVARLLLNSDTVMGDSARPPLALAARVATGSSSRCCLPTR